jgi:GDP-4-dehydro-6-deoxy-D-mannose reductase
MASRIAAAERDGASTIAVGNLAPRRDFTDVRDIVRAYRIVAVDGTPGEVYNVCSGVDRSIEEIALGLLEEAGLDLELVSDPDLVRPIDVPVVRGSNARLQRDTGWQPEIPIARSLADILDDARRRLDA